jgi:hypothetical protein
MEALLIAGLVMVVYRLSSLADAVLVGALNDDGVYAVLGRAIANGDGYRSIHLVGAPVQVKYPPGFPVILALLWKVGGSIETVQQLVGWLHPIVVGATAGLLWWTGRVRCRAPSGPLVLLVLMPLLLDSSIQYYTIVLSEPWYMLGWAAALAAWWAAGTSEPGRRRMILLMATGLLVSATTLVRTQGIVLVPALTVGLFLGSYSRLERGAALACMLVPLGLWHFYHAALIAQGPVAMLPDEGPYLEWVPADGARAVRSLLTAAARNGIEYPSQLGLYLCGITALGRGAAALLILGAMAGTLGVVRRDPVLGLSGFAGLVVVLLWPFTQDRLLLSVLPFGGLALGEIVGPVMRRWGPSRARALSAALVLLSAAVFVRQFQLRSELLIAFRENRPTTASPALAVLIRNSRFIALAAKWVRQHTKPSDRLLADVHAGIYLYTGRVTVPASPSESHLRASVFAIPGRYLATHILNDSLDYLIVGRPESDIFRDANTVFKRCPGLLTLKNSSGEDPGFLFQVRRDDACLQTFIAQGSAGP